MSSKRNQTIAIARFLMYKYGLNQQLEGMTATVLSVSYPTRKFWGVMRKII